MADLVTLTLIIFNHALILNTIQLTKASVNKLI